jgi:5-methylcytosine-specific restriction enzyme A
MNDRREFRDKVKAQAFERAKGRCEKCTARLVVGKFAYDHVIADALGGEPTLENCAVLCSACHGEKTPGDTTAAAKVKRTTRKLVAGIKKPTSRPIMGSRASGWRKPFNGPPERRY